MQLHLFDWFPHNSALTFARPWLLLLLLAIPLIAWLRGKRGLAAALTFSSTTALRAIGKQSQARAGKILRTLLLATLAIFVVAFARPQLGKSLTQVEASGIDIMLALDVSGSMLTKDFTIGGDLATRVDAIRDVTRKFIEGRPNDRIGIIAFAGRPYVVSPMTLDHDWLLQNLERVRIGLVEDGTAIGSAMAAASNRLTDRKSKSHVIVLLTDGENNAGKIPPNTAAEAIKALKIHFYAIGGEVIGGATGRINGEAEGFELARDINHLGLVGVLNGEEHVALRLKGHVGLGAASRGSCVRLQACDLLRSGWPRRASL